MHTAHRFCSLLVTAAAVFTGIANAASEPEPRQRTVNYADLDLNTSAGAAALYARLHHAAAIVCSTGYTVPLANPWQLKRCSGEAISRAVMDVNAPLLTAYHDDKINGTRVINVRVASGR